uniref:NR LBD domain-containing protein n=1 Tax=Acrobeloides nanus TaxID=290746 RepID=A0A914EEE4_9BILA
MEGNQTERTSDNVYNRFRKNNYKTVEKYLSWTIPSSIPTLYDTTFLRRLQYGFSVFYEEIKPKKEFKLMDRRDHDACSSFREKWDREYAKIFMHCKEFTNLQINDKILLYKNANYLFTTIERMYTSIECGSNEKNNYMLTYDNVVADLNHKESPNSINTYVEPFDRTKPLWISYRENLSKLLHKPMLNLRLTQFELVYILAQILWSTQVNFMIIM